MYFWPKHHSHTHTHTLPVTHQASQRYGFRSLGSSFQAGTSRPKENLETGFYTLDANTTYCNMRCGRDNPHGMGPPSTLKITKASLHHVAEHRPVRSESLQPHTERSSRPGPEPSSVEADVLVDGTMHS